MSDRNMIMVFCYDIGDARRRRKVAKTLEARAVRVQESVFEVPLTRKEANKLFDKVAIFLEGADSLRMYAVSAAGLDRTRVGGATIPPLTGKFYLI